MIPRLPPGFSHPMQIGEGTFGSVYRVRQQYLDRWVALKIIRETNKAQRSEFLKEARIQAKIKTDCVPQIYDAFEWKQSVCIVMQWVKGISLFKVLENECSSVDLITIAGGLIHALAQLHSLGFAHRDIKPANILINPQSGVYLVDFGFTRDITEMYSSSKSHVRGTPAYMAPEIWECGSDIDLMRADVYAMGMVLQQMFDGKEAVLFAKDLVERNPASRPESGRTVKRLWFESEFASNNTAQWKQIVEKNTTNELSGQLVGAAKQLIAIRRFDEAYNLLIESLEENPDNSDAIELMSRFASFTRRKPVSGVMYVSGVIILLATITGAYIAGKRSGKHSAAGSSSDEEIRVFMKYEESNDAMTVLPLRSKQDESGLYDGAIVIDWSDQSDPEGIVYINNKAYHDVKSLKNSVSLKHGIHTIVWKDKSGTVLYRETVNLLPFQTKRIKIPPVRKEK